MAELVEVWPPELSQRTDLEQALCRQVARTGVPLAVADLASWQSAEFEAQDGGSGAFVGVPLIGAAGEVLGVIGAFDTSPRVWDEQNLQDLSDLAAACSAELRLRASAQQAHSARRGAEAAQRTAELKTGAARGDAQRLQTMLDRSQLMLRAAEVLADTSGLGEVRRQVSDLVTGELKPSYVGLALLDSYDRMRRTVDALSEPVALEERFPVYELADSWPTARAARENRIVVIPDRQTLVDGYGPQTVAVFDAMGLCSAVCVPLPGTLRSTLGTLVLAWDTAHEVDLPERAVLTAIAGYTARAVERAVFLDDRISVARQLQQTMLTDLPTVPGLDLAALYRPAADHDMVGGDWYDAYPLATAAGEDRRPLAVTVGDITGHNMHAAALMGQARSMLRQADHDHGGHTPADAVTAAEHAYQSLGTGISGTLVHAHLTPRTHGAWLLEWTNAGHPAPLLASPGRATEQLTAHGRLIHPALEPQADRPHHQRLLTPGSLLLLYTDGLIEHRGKSLDAAIADTCGLLAQAAADTTPLPALLDHLADTLAGPAHEDDIVLLAVRIPPDQSQSVG
ncbi:GAF domain-containing SpoIIE family protein phosphatase [Streptomyces sp. NPDC096198]|uniref:GAF domain-containing SpoIIE family protein phosphatase n=1 Tax=Streptomyces sp. NPDC096198 TaxID=3366080 RepID=UPI00382D3741